MALVCLELKPPYCGDVAVRPFLTGYTIPKFQGFDGGKGNTWEYILHFLNIMGPFAHDANLCLRKFPNP